jgi:hypothetical protein
MRICPIANVKAYFGRSREDIFRFAIQMIETHGAEVDKNGPFTTFLEMRSEPVGLPPKGLTRKRAL